MTRADMTPNARVERDRAARYEAGRLLHRPHGRPMVTTHPAGIVGEAYEELLDAINYLSEYPPSSWLVRDALNQVHIAAELLAAEIGEDNGNTAILAARDASKDTEIAALEAKLAQVDDVLVVNWIAVKNNDYRQALADLIAINIEEHDNPLISTVAKARQDETTQLRTALREIQEAAGSVLGAMGLIDEGSNDDLVTDYGMLGLHNVRALRQILARLARGQHDHG